MVFTPKQGTKSSKRPPQCHSGEPISQLYCSSHSAGDAPPSCGPCASVSTCWLLLAGHCCAPWGARSYVCRAWHSHPQPGWTLLPKSQQTHLRWLVHQQQWKHTFFTTSSVYLQEDKQGKAKAKILLDYTVEIEEIRLYIWLGWICVRQYLLRGTWHTTHYFTCLLSTFEALPISLKKKGLKCMHIFFV